MTPHALPGTLAGSGVFEGERKSVRVASKMENLELTGVKNRCSGVTGVEIDSGVASQKKWRNFTGVNFIRFGVMKKSTGVRNNRIGVMKKQTGVKITKIGAITVKMGVRGTPRQDLAFRAHEMRILRRSMELPLPKKEGVAHGKTER